LDEFASEVADVCIDTAIVEREFSPERVLGEFGSIDRLPSRFGKQRDDAQFCRCQIQRSICPRRASTSIVNLEFAELDDRLSGVVGRALSTTVDSPQSRRQLARVEGLSQLIVGT
jgi:hypothetical protein